MPCTRLSVGVTNESAPGEASLIQVPWSPVVGSGLKPMPLHRERGSQARSLLRSWDIGWMQLVRTAPTSRVPTSRNARRSPMEDPRTFGHALASYTYLRIRDEGLTTIETSTLFGIKVAQRVREMEEQGWSGGAIADWVEVVARTYAERLDDKGS